MSAAPGTRLSLKQVQRLALTPALQQTFALLSLPGSELEEQLKQIAEENPFLSFTPRSAAETSNLGGAYDVAIQTVAATQSLGDHLISQIALMDLPPDVARLASELALNLDENGFIPEGGIAMVAAEYEVPQRIARQAVLALQSCEPTGVGALSLAECLSLQLADQGLDPRLVPLVIGHLASFLEGDLTILGPAIGVSPTMAREIAAMVRTLDPAPARAFETQDAVMRLPELQVSVTRSGGLRVELLNDPAPRLAIDAALAAARDSMEGGHYAAARALLQAIKYRGKTLLEIGQAVAQRQAAYFTSDHGEMEPLTRSEIATELGLHKSTVSRAVAGKTFLWEGQIMELASLFPARLGTAGKGATSSQAARARMLRLIAAETPQTVLSDSRICDILNNEGVDISRRTVAKYRKCLSIPSSSERRRLLSRAATARGPH